MPVEVPVAAPVIKPKKQVGVAEDVTKSVGSNLVGGGIDLAMTLPNLLNQAVAGPQLLGRGIADKVSPMLGIEPQPRGELWQPFYGSHDVEQAIGTAYEPQTSAGKTLALPSRIIGGIAGAKGIQKADTGLEKLLRDETTTATKAGLPVGGSPNKASQATADDIAGLSNQQYGNADRYGGVLKPNVTNKFIDETDALSRQTPEGRALAGDSEFTKTTEVLKGFRDRPLTLKAAQEIDEELSDRIDDLFISKPKQAKKLFEVQTKLRETMDNAADADVIGGKAGFGAWREGQRLWAAQARLRDIERIIARSERADNPATVIKNGFNTLLSNKSRTRGFTKDELKLMDAAAKNGVVGDLLGIVGSRLGPIIAGATGGLSSGVAAQATSMAARGARTKLQVNRATKVANSIANRAMNPPQFQPPPNFPSLNAPVSVALLEGPAISNNRITLPLEELRNKLRR